jgi:hypothetical protein
MCREREREREGERERERGGQLAVLRSCPVPLRLKKTIEKIRRKHIKIAVFLGVLS